MNTFLASPDSGKVCGIHESEKFVYDEVQKSEILKYIVNPDFRFKFRFRNYELGFIFLMRLLHLFF